MPKEVFLIDICGTMFKSNTTFDFVRYCYSNKSLRNKLLLKWWFSLPYRIYNRAMFRYFHREPLRKNLIHLLKGRTKAELRKEAEIFYHDYLAKCQNPEVISLIRQKKENGLYELVVSATLDNIAYIVKEEYAIDGSLSSILKYNSDNICSGYLDIDLLGNKMSALESLGIKPPFAGIVTDNFSDAPLIELSSEAWLVCYGKKTWNGIISENKLRQCHIIKV